MPLRNSNNIRIFIPQKGFSLIELVIAIVVLGILSAVASSRFSDVNASARTADIQALNGAVNSALVSTKAMIQLNGAGDTRSGDPSDITWVHLDTNTAVRVWQGYPDRWCDGVGMLLEGANVPSGGCYLSSSAVTYGNFNFYGYGNSQIPNGSAGWRIETAKNPTLCSVEYQYTGTSAPLVKAYTQGC